MEYFICILLASINDLAGKLIDYKLCIDFETGLSENMNWFKKVGMI